MTMETQRLKGGPVVAVLIQNAETVVRLTESGARSLLAVLLSEIEGKPADRRDIVLETRASTCEVTTTLTVANARAIAAALTSQLSTCAARSSTITLAEPDLYGSLSARQVDPPPSAGPNTKAP
jgi:hypothetical protein